MSRPRIKIKVIALEVYAAFHLFLICKSDFRAGIEIKPDLTMLQSAEIEAQSEHQVEKPTWTKYEVHLHSKICL